MSGRYIECNFAVKPKLHSAITTGCSVQCNIRWTMPRPLGRPTRPQKEGKPGKEPAPPNFVLQWREGRGWTLEQLAEVTGTTKTTIWRIENRQQGISREMGPRLTAAFGTSLAVLYSRGPTPEELGAPPQTPPRPSLRRH